ncbi:MAG: anthranilate synthase component I family protein [Planctomycetota bacterium]
MITATQPVECKTVMCRLHYRKLNTDADLSALSEVISKLPDAAILGGNPSKTEADGFSYWMPRPVDVFEFRTGQKTPFEKLQATLTKYRLADNVSDNLPGGIFTCGWVGCFSYDLGRYIEPAAFAGDSVSRDDLSLPLIRLCFYDRLIAYDHSQKAFWLIALEFEDDAETPQQKLSYLAGLLDRAEAVRTPAPPPADIENIDFAQIQSNMTKDYYLKAFDKIKRHIYDGDVYQINFSQRFDYVYHARPIGLFHWQNRYNPSPYSAYIDAGSFQIVSASPEMFITIRDRVISTKPIKGTRKRYEEASTAAGRLNAEHLRQLLSSEKEKAELNMIIDLERNDIARVSKPGTRKVTQPRTIETYPTVFHAVATVSGELRDNVNFCDILKAMFPGGSITGAPKIRSMQIIDEIEPTARGIYTGSIGFIGLDGSVCLNIAIRTIIIKNNTAYVQTGGGIVADSDSKAEYEETITKARALLSGIQAVPNRQNP